MAPKSNKRIVIACDGTWVNSDNGWVRKSWMPWNREMIPATPSNVTRLCRALNQKSGDNVQQIVYYQAGVGSANSFWSYLFGGYMGQGIDENIREAYTFLCNNYADGDEISLVGFSRGAFTARSIGGLISSVGILSKHGLGSFYPIYKDWENQTNNKYDQSQYSTQYWKKDRPSFRDAAYLQQLRKAELTSPTIPLIKAVGVWDTVGSLGVPTVKVLGIPLHTDTTIEYSFINTEVAPNIEYAYQALALDEQRAPFSPTVWESPKGQTALKELKQTWFPGVHSSIGGGYADTSISDISLAWMITQLSPHLSFNKEYVAQQRAQNEQFYQTRVPKVATRPWAMGLIKSSDLGTLNTMTGRQVRTPGEYHPTDPLSGKSYPTKMQKTCEFMHPSVRYRLEQHGPGLAQKEGDYTGQGDYQPKALQGWKYQVTGDVPGMTAEEKKLWADYGKWVVQREGENKPTFIVEETIEPGTAEMILVSGWPEGYKGVETKLYGEYKD